MLRLVALLATTGACWSTPASSPSARPAVDVARVRATLQGAWSTSMGGDLITQTDTFTFDERGVTRVHVIDHYDRPAGYRAVAMKDAMLPQ